jgi:hypothetical protein
MNASDYHIAQYNFALIKEELDSPVMEGFVSKLQDINALADRSPGFVWRLQTDKGDSTDIRPYEDKRMLVTLSVWETIEDMYNYVYRGDHAAMLGQRAKWFEHVQGTYIVLWWIPAGHIPSVDEGKERMAYLRTHGPTPYAFTFEKRFPVESLSSYHAVEQGVTDAGTMRGV